MGGMNTEKLPLLLDISEILANVSLALPSLLLGYNSLADGFNRTFKVLGTTDIGGGFGGSVQADYDPDFNVGLGNISTAIDHFSDSKPGVLNALGKAKNIVTDVIVDETGELGFIVQIVDQADAGYGHPLAGGGYRRKPARGPGLGRRADDAGAQPVPRPETHDVGRSGTVARAAVALRALH